MKRDLTRAAIEGGLTVYDLYAYCQKHGHDDTEPFVTDITAIQYGSDLGPHFPARVLCRRCGEARTTIVEATPDLLESMGWTITTDFVGRVVGAHR